MTPDTTDLQANYAELMRRIATAIILCEALDAHAEEQLQHELQIASNLYTTGWWTGIQRTVREIQACLEKDTRA